MDERRKDQAVADFKKLSRTISLVENEVKGFEEILQKLKPSASLIIGITGAPGAGKSSLVDGLVEEVVRDGKSVAVLCVDPSSPFSHGAVLGDRIRMSSWYATPGVFIRSMATRGALGGLNHKIIEVCDVLRDASFDYIIIETVGVGQSEVDIAALADITIVLLTPEGGDAIQNMKAGIMEIADIFVVNKSDRPGAEIFYNNLKKMLKAARKGDEPIPVVQTTASQKKGIGDLYGMIATKNSRTDAQNKLALLSEKAWNIIKENKVRNIDRKALVKSLAEEMSKEHFNLYRFAAKYF
ncbi:MAG: methylmalonyl Co-A mutase-associated GTPase MeaB [Bacteroidetes bacterium]|nr:methylmalonyl Co-A mutase-associated GTPase MeaB [Bacteroidota bacterium]